MQRFSYHITPREGICLLASHVDKFAALCDGHADGAAVHSHVRLTPEAVAAFESDTETRVTFYDHVEVRARFWQAMATQYPFLSISQLEMVAGERCPV